MSKMKSWKSIWKKILLVLLLAHLVIGTKRLPFFEYECPIKFDEPPRSVKNLDSTSSGDASTVYPSVSSNPKFKLACKHNIDGDLINQVESLFLRNAASSSLVTNNAYIKIIEEDTFINVTYFSSKAITLNQLGYFVFTNLSNQVEIVESGMVYNLIPSQWDSKYSFSKTVLIQGDTVVMGPFNAGQNVGFALYKDGFNLQHGTSNHLYVSSDWNYPPPPFYSVVSYPNMINPENFCPGELKSQLGCKHVAWIHIKKYDVIVMGFEDSLGLTSSEYNDNVFFVTVSKEFETPSIIKIEDDEAGQNCEKLSQIKLESYATSKCQQYALLESNENQCFGYMSPPPRWKLAPNDGNTIAIIKKLSKTNWAYAKAKYFVVEGGVAYDSDGNSSEKTMLSTENLDNNCYPLDCSIRYVLIGDVLENCITQSHCIQNEKGYVVVQTPQKPPDTDKDEYTMFPDQYDVFLSSNNGDILLSSLMSISKNNTRADIVILLDMYGMTAEDVDAFVGESRFTVTTLIQKFSEAGFYIGNNSNDGLRLLFSFCQPVSPSDYFLSIAGAFSNSVDVLSKQLKTASYSGYYGKNSSFIPECTEELVKKLVVHWRPNYWHGIWILSTQHKWENRSHNLSEIQKKSGIASVLYNPGSYCDLFFWDYKRSLNIPKSFIDESTAKANCGPSIWTDWYNLIDGPSALHNVASKIEPYHFSSEKFLDFIQGDFSVKDYGNYSQMDYTLSWSNLYEYRAYYNFSMKVGVMGYGTTKINVSFNQAPVASDLVLRVTEVDSYNLMLPVYDEDYETIKILITSLPTYGKLKTVDGNLITARDTHIEGINVIYELSDECWSCIDRFTWIPFDGCTYGNLASVNISLWTEKIPKVKNLEFFIDDNQKCNDSSAKVIDLLDYVYSDESDGDNDSKSELVFYFGSIPSNLGTLYSCSEYSGCSYAKIGVQENHRFCFEPNPGISKVTKASIIYQVKNSNKNVLSDSVTITFNIIHQSSPLIMAFTSAELVLTPGYIFRTEYIINDPNNGEQQNIYIDKVYGKFNTSIVQNVHCNSSNVLDISSGSKNLPFLCRTHSSTNSNYLSTGSLYWENSASSQLGETATISMVAVNNNGEVSNTFNVTLVSGIIEYYWTLVPPPIVKMEQGEVVINLKYGARRADSEDFDLNFNILVPPAHGSLILYSSNENLQNAKKYYFNDPSSKKDFFSNDNIHVKLDNSYIKTDKNEASLLIGYIPEKTYLGLDLFTIVLSDKNNNVVISRTVGVFVTLPQKPHYSNMKVFVRENHKTKISIPAFHSNGNTMNTECTQKSQTIVITKTQVETSSIYSLNNKLYINIPHMETIDLSKKQSFDYEFFSPLGAYKEIKNPYGVMEFYIVDNCGLSTDTHTLEIYVFHTNHAPKSNNYFGVVNMNEMLQIHFFASDIDSMTDPSGFKAQITSFEPRNKGKFYLDPEGTIELTENSILPDCVMYYISKDDYSKPESLPLARFTYVVWDDYMESSSTYFGQVRVLKPKNQKTYEGPLKLEIIKGSNGTIALRNFQYYNDSDTNYDMFITLLPDKGNLYHLMDDQKEVKLSKSSSDNFNYLLNSTNGIIIYEPPLDGPFESTRPFTYFNFSIFDRQDNVSRIWTIKILVLNVNSAPILLPQYLVNHNGRGDVVLDYNKVNTLMWIAQDPDSHPRTLVSSLAVSPHVSNECTLKYINEDMCDIGWGFIGQWKKSHQVRHYAVNSQNCHKPRHLWGDGCESYFKFEFNFLKTHYIPRLIISLQVADQNNKTSYIHEILATVEKDNVAPAISAPSKVYFDNNNNLVSLSHDDKTITLSDNDSFGNYEKLTVKFNGENCGQLVIPEEYQRRCVRKEDKINGSDTVHWECSDTIEGFNMWLPYLKFQISEIKEECTLNLTLNDMGHTSHHNPSPQMTASTLISIVANEKNDSSVGSTLGITLGVTAGGAILLTAIVYYLRQYRSTPRGDLPESNNPDSSIVANNPLYERQSQQFESPIYQQPNN